MARGRWSETSQNDHGGRERRAVGAERYFIELDFPEIKAQSVFKKHSIEKQWPHLVELTLWNTFKLQFVAIGSLFKSRGMLRRVIVATVSMFF